MVELKKRHTASFLKEEILNCLNKFDIKATQLYSSTTDNGSNVIKTSELLQEQDNVECEIHNRLSSVMSVVRCAVHTLQLCAHDVYKTHKNELAVCREATRSLRKIIRNNYVDEDIRMPTLDNATRWNSTFDMLTSLLDLRTFVNDHAICCEVNWDFIQNFVYDFKPVSECTKSLQTDSYTIGDFYRDWLLCEAQLENIQSNEFAIHLLQSMQSRKTKLLENNAFNAALYMDRRFNYMDSPFLNEIQKKQAVTHIINTSAILSSLEGCTEIGSDSEIDHAEQVQVFDDKYDLLERKANSITQQSVQVSQNIQSLRLKLEGLAQQSKMPFNTDIINYWKNLQIPEPTLSKLSQIILSVPSSQTSVERAFSALSLILTKHRSRLSSENLNNLLFIKLNENLFKNINLDVASDVQF
ncbi:uncharacterized protein LOC118732368 [Rhagoletis pomonella]|uniref:uncharacterized protein LOC118732368 n=1 Tax=Rhagoletis pomonella TaxID=28610 RepID=UPI0017804B83|nr:uncharacterized protein LOC118732368 [Rhagoletis pomonella]